MAAQHYTGFVSLADADTDEVLHAAVMVTVDDQQVTYTAMTPDRTRRLTIRADRQDAPFFVRMMETVREVALEPA